MSNVSQKKANMDILDPIKYYKLTFASNINYSLIN